MSNKYLFGQSIKQSPILAVWRTSVLSTKEFKRKNIKPIQTEDT